MEEILHHLGWLKRPISWRTQPSTGARFLPSTAETGWVGFKGISCSPTVGIPINQARPMGIQPLGRKDSTKPFWERSEQVDLWLVMIHSILCMFYKSNFHGISLVYVSSTIFNIKFSHISNNCVSIHLSIYQSPKPCLNHRYSCIYLFRYSIFNLSVYHPK